MDPSQPEPGPLGHLLPRPGDGERVDMRLLRVPLRLWLRAEEHTDDLLREFALIQAGQARPEPHHVPARLLELVEVLTAAYADTSAAAEEQRNAGLAAGLATLDLTYPGVPMQVGAAASHIGQLLDEADEYCRTSGQLLTLAAPPDLREFRVWFLGEFAAQAAGSAPTAWTGPLD